MEPDQPQRSFLSRHKIAFVVAVLAGWVLFFIALGRADHERHVRGAIQVVPVSTGSDSVQSRVGSVGLPDPPADPRGPVDQEPQQPAPTAYAQDIEVAAFLLNGVIDQRLDPAKALPVCRQLLDSIPATAPEHPLSAQLRTVLVLLESESGLQRRAKTRRSPSFARSAGALAPAPPLGSPSTYSAPGYQPGCAENGSCYGDISAETGRAKTTYVNGYTRKDGTYVRGHYRSR
jgi:hypothetical protein